MSGAPCRNRSTARRMNRSLDAYIHWLHERRAELHPDDLRHEPANFASWCASCESEREELLLLFEERIRGSIDAAFGSADKSLYVEMRRFFHRYVSEALRRRFRREPPLLAIEYVEDIPF